MATIMTAHVVYDGIDKNTPATFSVKILRDILRDELKFEGLIVSDDLSMGAIAKHGSLEEACEKAFIAGCDLLITGKDPKKIALALDHFARAIEEERIPTQRVEQALERMTVFKKHFCRPRREDLRPKLSLIGSKGHQELLNKINQMA